MALTKNLIKAAITDGKKRWLKDGKVPGLGVLVLPSGVKTWYLRYYLPDGKEQQHRIGRADAIGPELAREEAHKVLAAAAKGDRPTAARQELRRSPTITQLAQDVANKHYWKLKPGTRANYEVIWRRHLLPTFGAAKVAQLRTREVYDWFTELSQESPVKANRCLEVLSKALNLAEVWGLRPKHSNPCDDIEANPEGKRKRYLSPAEAARLGQALDQFHNTPGRARSVALRWRFAQLVRLLLLTGSRLNEVMSARWGWVDWDGARLVVPWEHHKTGQDREPRVIRLTPEAVTILRELRAKTDGSWVIPGDGDGPLVGYRKLWLALLEQAQIADLRVHDLRHSFASFAISFGGLNLPALGQLLGHQSSQTTERYAHLIDEAAAAAATRTGGLISSALAGRHGQVAVVPASDGVGALRLAGNQMEHHLSDLHPRPQANGVPPPDVLKLQRQPAPVPAGIAVASQEMLQALACAAALQNELARNMSRQVEHLSRLSQAELPGHQQERELGGVLGNAVSLESLTRLLLQQQVLAQGQVQAGGVEQLLGVGLHHLAQLAQPADFVVGEDHEDQLPGGNLSQRFA